MNNPLSLSKAQVKLDSRSLEMNANQSEKVNHVMSPPLSQVIEIDICWVVGGIHQEYNIKCLQQFKGIKMCPKQITNHLRFVLTSTPMDVIITI